MSKGAWRNRIVGQGNARPNELLPNPRNWRMHPDSQKKVASSALGAIGWIQQPIVNRTTGHLIDGHMRVAMAVDNGEESVPVLYVDLDEAEEAQALALLDPIGAMAAADNERLTELLDDIQTDDSVLAAYFGDMAEDAEAGTMRKTTAGSDRAYSSMGRADLLKLVIACNDIEKFETAMQMTGEITRGEAILKICEVFIAENRQSDASPESKSSR